MIIFEIATAAGAAAESAAGQVEGDLGGSSGPVELDEFGRDVNLMKRKEAEERSARRRRRAQTELERFDRDKVMPPWLGLHAITDVVSLPRTWHLRTMPQSLFLLSI